MTVDEMLKKREERSLIKVHWIDTFHDFLLFVDSEQERFNKMPKSNWKIKVEKKKYKHGNHDLENVFIDFCPCDPAEIPNDHQAKLSNVNDETALKKKFENPDSIYTSYEAGLRLASLFLDIVKRNTSTPESDLNEMLKTAVKRISLYKREKSLYYTIANTDY